ncbi:MAG: DUF3843 family protein [Clostridium sp.]|nr:DUF3843 family protein [Clostridium sp.]
MAENDEDINPKILSEFESQISDLFDDVVKNMTNDERKEFIRDMYREVLGFRKISDMEWSETHPDSTRCGSDRFYADLTNKLQATFSENLFEQLPPYRFVRVAAMSITAYLEDLKSETGVWSAVRSLYQARYGKKLPFYETTEEYYDDDINIEDIKVLIWQAFNRCGSYDDRIFSPYSAGVDILAEQAFDILVENYDKAPEATRIRDIIDRILRRGWFFELRSLALWMNIRNPLTASPFIAEYIENSAEELGDTYSEKYSELPPNVITAMKYNCEMEQSWLEYVSLVGCSTGELLSEIARASGYYELAEKLRTAKYQPAEEYKVESVDKETVVLRDKFGDFYNVAKDSFRPDSGVHDTKRMYLPLTNIGDRYYVNGFTMTLSELTETETNFATKNNRHMSEFIDKVVAEKGGRRIFYCGNLKEVSQALSTRERELPVNAETFADDESITNYLVTLSNTDGIRVKPNACGIFRDKKNPYYIKHGGDYVGDEAMEFIVKSRLPDDLIEYIVANNLLPSAYMYAHQGKRFGKKIVQDNMDFLFHFYRVDTHGEDIRKDKEED